MILVFLGGYLLYRHTFSRDMLPWYCFFSIFAAYILFYINLFVHMKKRILAAAIMMATTSAFAQREAGSITVQPRIGVSAADFNNTGDTEARVGEPDKGSMGSASVNLKNDVKGFDLAVPVGLSYEFKHFVLDARYTFGLTKVFDDFDTKNLTFQLTLGYKIDL